MVRHIDCATQFASIDPVEVHFSFCGRDQYVVFARMDVKTRNLAFSDKELNQLRFGHATVPDVHKLYPDAIGCRHCVNFETGVSVQRCVLIYVPLLGSLLYDERILNELMRHERICLNVSEPLIAAFHVKQAYFA